MELVVWDKRQLERQVEELRIGNKMRSEKWEGETTKFQEQVLFPAADEIRDPNLGCLPRSVC